MRSGCLTLSLPEMSRVKELSAAAYHPARKLLSQSVACNPHWSAASTCLVPVYSGGAGSPLPVASCHTGRDASSLAASCCSCELMAASRLHTALSSACGGPGQRQARERLRRLL